MALNKNVKMENGLILNYHRITSLNKITNVSNCIEVSSYLNEEEREREKAYQELQKKSARFYEIEKTVKATGMDILTDAEKEELEKGINVLIESTFIVVPYDVTMTIESAYDYLKTLDKFKNSEDI